MATDFILVEVVKSAAFAAEEFGVSLPEGWALVTEERWGTHGAFTAPIGVYPEAEAMTVAAARRCDAAQRGVLGGFPAENAVACVDCGEQPQMKFSECCPWCEERKLLAANA